MTDRIPSPTKNRELLKSLFYFLERKFDGHKFTSSTCGDFIEIHSVNLLPEILEHIRQIAFDFTGRSGQIASRIQIETVAKNLLKEDSVATTPIFEGVVETDIEGVYFLGERELAAMNLLDRLFTTFPKKFNAVEIHAPSLISKHTLQRAGYIEKEAHQIGHVHTGTETCCLTPAACLTSYPIIAKNKLDESPKVFTLRSPVYRMEGNVFPKGSPLSRMREYNVREVIFFGNVDFMNEIKNNYFETVIRFAEKLDLQYELSSAADIFFHSENSNLAIHQLINKTKYELSFIGQDQPLAISSINFHGRHFIDAFSIQSDTNHLVSSCVGFGLERWLRALLLRHGDIQTAIKVLKGALL